tara:strand:+ start:1 stop:1197 length:1197 start_codon:yes stop_codon:yes gene_type:complete
MEMAGLAQKGGAVHIHCRIAKSSKDISAVRVSLGEAHALIGCELAVSAGDKTLSLLRRGRTKALVSSQEANSGEFTRDPDFKIPSDGMKLAINARLGPDSVQYLSSQMLADFFLGDTIYANIIVLGASYQAGLVPLSVEALKQAIRLNGANVDNNLKAFDLGRLWVEDSKQIVKEMSERKVGEPTELTSFESIVNDRYGRLMNYQNRALAEKYKSKCFEIKLINEKLGISVARAYYKVLAYKDEYEVARLHYSTLKKQISENFDGVTGIKFHLAPPLLSKKGADGKLKKLTLGSWILLTFRFLMLLKVLRGTVFDFFGYSLERKSERDLIKKYEGDIEEMKRNLSDDNFDLCMGLSLWPMEVKGFGHVKAKNIKIALSNRSNLLGRLLRPALNVEAAE